MTALITGGPYKLTWRKYLELPEEVALQLALTLSEVEKVELLRDRAAERIRQHEGDQRAGATLEQLLLTMGGDDAGR